MHMCRVFARLIDFIVNSEADKICQQSSVENSAGASEKGSSHGPFSESDTDADRDLDSDISDTRRWCWRQAQPGRRRAATLARIDHPITGR